MRAVEVMGLSGHLTITTHAVGLLALHREQCLLRRCGPLVLALVIQAQRLIQDLRCRHSGLVHMHRNLQSRGENPYTPYTTRPYHHHHTLLCAAVESMLPYFGRPRQALSVSTGLRSIGRSFRAAQHKTATMDLGTVVAWPGLQRLA